MPAYIPPDKVHSPKAHWSLIAVLEDLGEEGTSVAIGRWDGKPTLAMRWNGSDGNPIGNPQSRGLPTWFIIPSGPKTESFLKTLPANKQALARNFIPTVEAE
ncbi:MAG TPA: hypothetical protein VG796_24870 [Verrucomicrobiales bacterium]|nr:hypothetical protein [Verrucomicrobiales bacterium]